MKKKMMMQMIAPFDYAKGSLAIELKLSNFANDMELSIDKIVRTSSS